MRLLALNQKVPTIRAAMPVQIVLLTHMMRELRWPLKLAQTDLAEIDVAIQGKVERRCGRTGDLRGRLKIMIVCLSSRLDVHNEMV